MSDDLEEVFSASGRVEMPNSTKWHFQVVPVGMIFSLEQQSDQYLITRKRRMRYLQQVLQRTKASSGLVSGCAL